LTSSHVTRNGTGWSNGAQDLIELVDPDPSWPEQFALEAAALRSLTDVPEGVQIDQMRDASYHSAICFEAMQCSRKNTHA
jgi:hypothetical protein